VFYQRKRLCDASLTVLIGVVDMLETKSFSVSQELEKVSG
jgi:hypothetical protein